MLSIFYIDWKLNYLLISYYLLKNNGQICNLADLGSVVLSKTCYYSEVTKLRKKKKLKSINKFILIKYCSKVNEHVILVMLVKLILCTVTQYITHINARKKYDKMSKII